MNFNPISIVHSYHGKRILQKYLLQNIYDHMHCQVFNKFQKCFLLLSLLAAYLLSTKIPIKVIKTKLWNLPLYVIPLSLPRLYVQEQSKETSLIVTEVCDLFVICNFLEEHKVNYVCYFF